MVKVADPPIGAGSGATLFVTPRSAEVTTCVSAVDALSFGSGSDVVVLTVAVFDSVEPPASAGSVCSTRVNPALPGGNVAIVQFTVPVAFTAGVVQFQPAGMERLANVVCAGSGSSSTAFAASDGPSLLTVIVYVMSAPAMIGLGWPLFRTEIYALCARTETCPNSRDRNKTR